MEVKKLHGMGNHLIIDGYNCSKRKLNDKSAIKNFLNNLVRKIDLKKIKGPVVVKHNAKIKGESGITAFVILAESHISIHTYPEKQFLSLDVFTCKEFNLEEIKDYINKTFDIKTSKEFLIKRGM